VEGKGEGQEGEGKPSKSGEGGRDRRGRRKKSAREMLCDRNSGSRGSDLLSKNGVN
jgi:hypothetical protein